MSLLLLYTSAPPPKPSLSPNFALEALVLANAGSAACLAEYQFMTNTEAITLFRKNGDGSFDGGTYVANALRLETEIELTGGARLVGVKKSLAWLVWSSQTKTPDPKIGDVIQDGAGVRWTVWHMDRQAWGARFFLKTQQER